LKGSPPTGRIKIVLVLVLGKWVEWRIEYCPGCELRVAGCRCSQGASFSFSS
jgi:hypothetical protein